MGVAVLIVKQAKVRSKIPFDFFEPVLINKTEFLRPNRNVISSTNLFVQQMSAGLKMMTSLKESWFRNHLLAPTGPPVSPPMFVVKNGLERASKSSRNDNSWF